MSGPIILDLSRLLARAARVVPTGIDRVERAYAETLFAAARTRLRYAALHPLGRLWRHAMPGSGADAGHKVAGVHGLAPIATWSPPSWAEHVEAVIELIDELPQAAVARLTHTGCRGVSHTPPA